MALAILIGFLSLVALYFGWQIVAANIEYRRLIKSLSPEELEKLRAAEAYEASLW